MSAPNKEARQKCWDARDALWDCLDKNSENPKPCEKFNRAFVENCTKQWVQYFSRRRGYLKFKEKMEKDGFDPVEETNKQ